MEAPYRDGADSLRARADSLELENVVLRSRVRRLEAHRGKLERKDVINWLTASIVMVLGVAGIGPGLAQPDPASVVRIELSEYAFTPAQVTLKAGRPVTLHVVNTGLAPHMFASPYLSSQNLEIEGAEMDVDAPNGVKYVKLQPGKSAEIKFTPTQKGTFDFTCDLKSQGRSHRARGMTGRLVVY